MSARVDRAADRLSAGTQVVSLVEVRGMNHSLVQLHGAVGVITRTPAVEGETFLVRFPGGFEAALDRSQREVLKRFKDRLGEVGRGVLTPPASTDGSLGTASPALDLEQFGRG